MRLVQILCVYTDVAQTAPAKTEYKHLAVWKLILYFRNFK